MGGGREAGDREGWFERVFGGGGFGRGGGDGATAEGSVHVGIMEMGTGAGDVGRGGAEELAGESEGWEGHYGDEASWNWRGF